MGAAAKETRGNQAELILLERPVSVAKLPAYAGQIVEVEGLMEAGKYSPRLGPCELIPPEITTTEQYYEADYYAKSPPG